MKIYAFVNILFFAVKIISETVLREWKTSYPRVNPSSDILFKRLVDVIDYMDSGQNGNYITIVS